MNFIITTYDIICAKCGRIVTTEELGEYPYSWQFLLCSCGGCAYPDLKSPHEQVFGNMSKLEKGLNE